MILLRSYDYKIKNDIYVFLRANARMCDPFARNTNLVRPFTKKKNHQLCSFLQYLLINPELRIVLLLFADFSSMHEFEIFEPIRYNAIVHAHVL